MPKTLCLHGFLQTADFFRQKTGFLHKSIGKADTFVFLDAPFKVGFTPDEVFAEPWEPSEANGGSYFTGFPPKRFQTPNRKFEGNSQEPRRGWCIIDPDESCASGTRAFGMQESVDYLDRALLGERPETVVSFSQGATTMICWLYKYYSPSLTSGGGKYSFLKNVVLASPWFPPANEMPGSDIASPLDELAVLANDGKVIDCGGLRIECIMGRGDKFVPFSGVERLTKVLPTLNLTLHDGGHFLPSSGPAKEVLKSIYGRC